MGISWQSGLKGLNVLKDSNGNDIVGRDIVAPDGPDYQTIGAVAAILGLAALAVLAPEVLLAIGADSAAETGAAEAPAWVLDAVDNPGKYAADSMDFIRTFYPKLYYAPPVFDIPASELPF